MCSLADLSRFTNMKHLNCIPNAIMIECYDSKKRTDIVYEIVKIILCENTSKKLEIPCDECNSCKKNATNSHPDYRVFGNTEKALSVNEVREIILDAYILPTESKYKVYNIENANMMTVQAQNALLKILEEPPINVIFILSCSSMFGILETIKSRTQIFKFTQDTDNTTEESDEIKEIVNAMMKYICNEDFSSIFLQISSFTKDRNLFGQVLISLDNLLADRLRLQTISGEVPSSKMVQIRDLVRKTQKKIKSNANQNLLSTWFFMKLQDIS